MDYVIEQAISFFLRSLVPGSADIETSSLLQQYS